MDNSKIKALVEKRNDKLAELQKLTDTVEQEERAFTDDEKTKFKGLEDEVRSLGDTIEACKKEWQQDIEKLPEEKREEIKQEEAEERAFVDYIRGLEISEELRADSNWTVGDNGAIIPTRIANKIIEEVKNKCQIFDHASKFNIGGTLSFPVYEEGIKMAYQDEFSTLEATAGKFKSIELKGYLAGALTKISRSLINNTDFDLFPYVVSKMAEQIADFLEQELLKGTADKIDGLSKVEATVTTLDADGLIDLQDSINKSFQPNCRWIMNAKTKNKIRKFKDGQGNYLLERNYENGDGTWLLLNKPVELTDVLEDDVVYYGDFSGLYVKIAENPNMQLLLEKYATEHAIGIVAWLEIDAKVVETQKIAKLKVGE